MKLTYLDNAATSFPKPESVYQAMDQFSRTSLGNPGRTSHQMARSSEHELNQCRHLLNQFFHGEGPERFIFTLNCTDALNMAIKGTVQPGDHVVTSNLEHNSVSRPLEALRDDGTIALTRVAADATGTLSPDAIRSALTNKTRLVVLTHASNVLGTLQPIAEIGDIVRKHKALLLVDAAQTAGVVPIDVRDMQVDLLAMPGHKALLGPTGTGVLYAGPRANVGPWREGGTGGNSTERIQPKEYPHHLEGGTPNVHGIVGLKAGLEEVMTRGAKNIWEHENALTRRLIEHLQRRTDFTIYGHLDDSKHVGTLSFNHPSRDSIDLAGMLDSSFNIAVRPYLHCSPYIHQAIGTMPNGTVRVSPGIFNTEDDIDYFADALHQILG
jgi:cysteine desulfurase family protein